jgi:integrase
VVLDSRQKRPSTKTAYLRAVQSFLDFAGAVPSHWTGHAVERWRDALHRAGRKPRTVNAMLSAVKFAAKRLHALDPRNPDFAAAAERFKVYPEKLRTPISVADARRILDAISEDTPRDLRDRALLILGFRTGLRRESLQRLAFEDIDFRAHRMTVVIKGGRRHVLAFDPEVGRALGAWATWLRRLGVASGRVFRALRSTVARGGLAIGATLSPAAINQLVKQRAAAVGIPFHPHLMRHCFVSWAVSRGVSPAEIMRATGHRNMDMIALYTSLVPGDEAVGTKLPTLTRREE